jgi:hypothetical protein
LNENRDQTRAEAAEDELEIIRGEDLRNRENAWEDRDREQQEEEAV